MAFCLLAIIRHTLQSKELYFQLAILDGELEDSDFAPDPNFKILIPSEVPGIETTILNPKNTWKDQNAYDMKAKELISLFKSNFVKYESFGSYSNAGPD